MYRKTEILFAGLCTSCKSFFLQANQKQGEGIMSGWQLSGDAPIAYDRFALKVMEPWTDDLILAGGCRDGDRVLDVASGTGLVACRVSLFSRKFCASTGIDFNEGMLSVPPIAYDRFALKVMEPWTDDLILAGGCRDG